MKSNYINVVFVIDESGSMIGTESDVINGFQKIIDEQKNISKGTCTVSYYKFNSDVTEVYKGIDVNEVKPIDKSYSPQGFTALFDGIGVAVDRVGKWLDSMKEEDKPEKTLVVIMTDGEENSSKEYTSEIIRNMIKEQEEKYNWTFMYVGSDLTNSKDASQLGIYNRLYSDRSDYLENYEVINLALNNYRLSDADVTAKSMEFNSDITESCINATTSYASKNNIDVNYLLS